MAVQAAPATPEARSRPMTREERKVILASSLGTVFEWYDFYLYGSLAVIIGAQFFSAFDVSTRNVFALLAFAAGFLVRPFGALFFGRLGDLIGRKATFLITILLMGVSTFLVGLLPSYETIGWVAPVVLIALRMAQGLALGGEYGGAAVYVAEHAPQGRRGFYTSWIQTTATLGLLLSLVVILSVRLYLGEQAFQAWGWRIPFLVSVFLLGISVWIRLQMQESPAFQKMKEEGSLSKAPLSEAFAQWRNLKIVIFALLGLVAGQAVVWYTGQFYALFFLQSILKVDLFTANVLIAWSLILGTGGFIFFGALSDKIGRKPVILAGCLIAALSYFTLFDMLTRAASPKLASALQNVQVRVVADPATCGSVFDPVGIRTFTSPCDVARVALARAAIKYELDAWQARLGDRGDVQRQAGGARSGAAEEHRQLHGRRRGGRLSESGRPQHRQDRQCHTDDIAGLDHHRHPHDPRAVRHDGLRPDRGGAGRVLPDPHPLHGDVAPLPHRQRLVRRVPAADRVRHGGGHRRHLLRPVVPDRGSARHLRDRPVLRPGNLQAGHFQGVGWSGLGLATSACWSRAELSTLSPAERRPAGQQVNRQQSRSRELASCTEVHTRSH